MTEIQRYNQGFGGFGPLEKCDTGKLMKAEDVLPVINGATLSIREANNNADYWHGELIIWKRKALLLRESMERIKLICVATLVGLVVIIASFIAFEVAK